MKLKDLLRSLDILETRNVNMDLDIEGIACHSTKVEPGFIYVAIKGYITDGHKYIEQALSKGAVTLIVEEFNDELDGFCQVKVQNSRKALSRLSSNFYDNPTEKTKVVGVTATNGKTTTTFILDYIYTKAGYKTGMVGSVLSKTGKRTELASLTTPESLHLQCLFSEMVEENVDRAVMEASSSALELYRVNDVDYDIVSFNNFSREHIDQHGSFERYWEVKSSLIRDAKPEAIAVLNVDNEKIASLITDTCAKVVTISVDCDEGMINCKNLKLVKGRGVFDIVIKDNINLGDLVIDKGSFQVELKIPGYHSVENAMMAIAIALADGVDRDIIVESLKEFGGVERRFEFIYENEFTIIDDHFANIKNINSTLGTIADMDKNKVHIAYAIRGNRGVTVNRENAQALMDWKEKLGIEEVIATRSLGSVGDKDAVSSEEESVFREVLDDAGIKYRIFDTIKEAIETILEKSEKDDIVLLAGCQGMDRGARIAFDYIHRKNPDLDSIDLYKPLTKRVAEEGFIL
ncbi:Mur ligase family protein [Gudongella sp. DL1XJH-153]|uniref:Mur ligase family protein n=1 Tax=Gudongella sp. DL1XJH-153 TaxID=3409804 RepID=UPI003BB49272